MVMKILFVGGAMVDIVARMHKPSETDIHGSRFVCVKEGSKHELEGISLRFGGSAANSAVAAKRLGHDARIITAVGDDEFGKLVKQDLEANGVGGAILAKKGSATAAGIILLTSGEKSSLVYHGALEKLSADDIPEHMVKWCDAVFITSMTAKKNVGALNRVIRLAEQLGKRVVFAPSMTMLKALPREVKAVHGNFDIVVMNEEEAEEYTGEKDSGKMLGKLPGAVRVITRGAKGAVATDGSETVRIKAVDERIVDTTGAGDAFSAAFAAEYLSGMSLEESLIIATATAALKMQSVGAHLQGTRKEIAALVMKYNIKTRG